MLQQITLALALCSLTLAAPQPNSEQLTFNSADLITKGNKLAHKVLDKATDWVKDQVTVFEEVVTEGITRECCSRISVQARLMRPIDKNESLRPPTFSLL